MCYFIYLTWLSERSLTSSKTNKITSILKVWKFAPAPCLFSRTLCILPASKICVFGWAVVFSSLKHLSPSLSVKLLSLEASNLLAWVGSDHLCAATASGSSLYLTTYRSNLFVVHIHMWLHSSHSYRFLDIWCFILLWAFSVHQNSRFVVIYDNYSLNKFKMLWGQWNKRVIMHMLRNRDIFKGLCTIPVYYLERLQ